MSNISIILNPKITKNDLIPYYANYIHREETLQAIKTFLDDLIMNKSHTDQGLIFSTSDNTKLIIKMAENTYNSARNKLPELDLWYSLCNRTSFDIENAHKAINKALGYNCCSSFKRDKGVDTYSTLVKLRGFQSTTYADVVEQAAYVVNILSDFEEGNILTLGGRMKLLP